MKTFRLALLSLMAILLSSNTIASSKVIIAVNTEARSYFVDEEGNFLFCTQFDWVEVFSEGLAKVGKDDKYGFINTQGEVVLPCIYDSIKPFSEGLAWVVEEGKWPKWSIINTSGKVIVEDCDHWDAATSWSRVEF